MASDAQIPNGAAAHDQLRALQDQFDEIYIACLEDGDLDEEELQLINQLQEKLARAEEAINASETSGPIGNAAPYSIEGGIAGQPTANQEGGSTPNANGSLSAPVGQGGRNTTSDVALVQDRLNSRGSGLMIDGLIGPKTIGAISKFQNEMFGFADGRVDPNGQTWQALNTGPAAPPPAGYDDDLKGLIDELPENNPPPKVDNNETPDEEKDGPTGVWVGAETSIELGPLTFKVATNENGQVTGGGIELQKKVEGPTVAIPPYYFGCAAALFGEVSLQGPGPRIDVHFRVGGKGIGFLGVGPAIGGFVAGFKVEVEISGLCKAPFDGILDVETPAESEMFFGLPLEFSLGGAIKAGVEIKAPGLGLSQMLPVREYKDFVFLRIESGPDYTLALGPGYEQFISDVKNAHELVIEAVKEAEKNPKLVGTGGTGPLLVDEANSIADDIHRVAAEALVAALRQAEQQMQSAYQAGWADPGLVGKANALNQQNQDLARDIYGQAWTKRALAKQSYDQYGSPLDTASEDIINARLNQALSIAAQFIEAVTLFQQGDGQW